MGITWTHVSNVEKPVFTIDSGRSNDQYLFVNIKDKVVVIIENREDGLEASIYPIDAAEGTESVADMSVTNDELLKEEEE